MNNINISTGEGFWSLLAVAFIVLKLCHVINWSWWWVLLPLYGGFLFTGMILMIPLLALIGAGVTYIMLLIVEVIKNREKKK